MENLWYNAKGLNERSAFVEAELKKTLALEKRKNIHLDKQVALLVAASFWSCPTVTYLRIRFSLYSLADVKSTGSLSFSRFAGIETFAATNRRALGLDISNDSFVLFKYRK